MCCVCSPETCLLSNNVNDYYFVSQGKTTIPNVDDGEEFRMTDVSALLTGDAYKMFSLSHILTYL